MATNGESLCIRLLECKRGSACLSEFGKHALVGFESLVPSDLSSTSGDACGRSIEVNGRSDDACAGCDNAISRGAATAPVSPASIPFTGQEQETQDTEKQGPRAESHRMIPHHLKD